MANTYFEDLFVKFFDHYTGNNVRLVGQDNQAAHSFYDMIIAGRDLTSSQGNYILKLLNGYRAPMKREGFDYEAELAVAEWKKPFRLLDLSKRVYIEKDKLGTIRICLKHPFSLKDIFEKEVLKKSGGEKSEWDPEDKVRKFSIYDLNLMLVHDFAVRHKFEIDESFEQCLSDMEQIWQDADTVVPSSLIFNNEVLLKNATESAVAYFESHKTNTLDADMLLAKSLGYKLETEGNSLAEKIASSTSNQFWADDNKKFFDLYKNITGPIVMLVSEDHQLKKWLETFIAAAKENGIDDSEFRIGFRAGNNEDPEFNNWIKSNGYGGNLASAKLLIFKNKPPKWLFKDGVDVKIIVVNKPFPPSSALSQSWISNHSCVVYLGNIRPSINKENNIVNL